MCYNWVDIIPIINSLPMNIYLLIDYCTVIEQKVLDENIDFSNIYRIQFKHTHTHTQTYTRVL
jgi:hypothetical protein